MRLSCQTHAVLFVVVLEGESCNSLCAARLERVQRAQANGGTSRFINMAASGAGLGAGPLGAAAAQTCRDRGRVHLTAQGHSSLFGGVCCGADRRGSHGI
eukprot:6183461-Pleurochrysis_carterae.AAC.6